MSRQHLTAGIDVGSAAIKIAIMKSQAGQDGAIVSTVMQRIRRRRIDEVVDATMAEACEKAGVTRRDFDYVATTGDADAIDFATGHFYGMTTHARGALFLQPEARAALDIGALHARALKFDGRGKVLGHRMTSQCASGSGQFLENIARYLGVPLEDVGSLSSGAARPEEVSSICAVLAETDVINMVSRGLSAADILKGIHMSLSGRLIRLLRAVGADGVVALTGGLAHDVGMVKTLNDDLVTEKAKAKGKHVHLECRTHEAAACAGAIGAALLGAYRHDQLARSGRLAAVAGATS
jgi:benzoyl-CoA reductase subunit D